MKDQAGILKKYLYRNSPIILDSESLKKRRENIGVEWVAKHMYHTPSIMIICNHIKLYLECLGEAINILKSNENFVLASGKQINKELTSF